MNDKQKTKFLVDQYIKLRTDLSRPPTRVEFVISFKNGDYFLRGSGLKYSDIVSAASLIIDQSINEKRQEQQIKILKSYTKLCRKKELLSGFVVHKLDLKEMFNRAGNPKVLLMAIQPDTHVEYMDETSVECFIQFVEYFKPHVWAILGDYLDCLGVSHWPSESLASKRLIPEVTKGRWLLDTIDEANSNFSTKLYCKGNHEHWIEQGLLKFPELFDGLDLVGMEINLNKLLQLPEREIQLFELNHVVDFDKLLITHGTSTAKHHAMGHLNIWKKSIIYGHLHDNQTFQESSIYGLIEASCSGTLSRVDAKFLRGKSNNWTKGFQFVEMFPSGEYFRYFIRIIDGKISFAGKVFDGSKGLRK